MKHSFSRTLLSCFPFFAGALGFALRLWLFSATDEKGLLPASHIADSALYILTAITLAVLSLASRNSGCTNKVSGFSAAIGSLFAGTALLAAALMEGTIGTVRLAPVAYWASLLGALAMFIAALLHSFRKKVPYYLNAVLTVALMLVTVAQGQVWGAVPQLQAYFFPLLASVFLILSAYQATACSAGQGKPKHLIFFSRSALFLCCLCLNTAQWPLYLGMLIWAAVQPYSCISTPKEA